MVNAITASRLLTVDVTTLEPSELLGITQKQLDALTDDQLDDVSEKLSIMLGLLESQLEYELENCREYTYCDDSTGYNHVTEFYPTDTYSTLQDVVEHLQALIY